MRKAVFFAIMSLFLFSCSDQHKAENLIKKYLRLNLDDFKSYESVEFGKIQNDSSSILDESDYFLIQDSMLHYSDRAKKMQNFAIHAKSMDKYDEARLFLWASNIAADSTEYYINKLEKYKSEYKPKLKGYKVKHVFRSNDNGNSKIFKHMFHFTMKLDSITYWNKCD